MNPPEDTNGKVRTNGARKLYASVGFVETGEKQGMRFSIETGIFAITLMHFVHCIKVILKTGIFAAPLMH